MKINPILEMLKAIEIVHGKARAQMWWRLIHNLNPELLREVRGE